MISDLLNYASSLLAALLASSAPLLALLLVAGGLSAAVSRLAGATVRNMQARGFYADSAEYLQACQLYGWSATIRSIAFLLILPAVAFALLPALAFLAYALLAGFSIASRVIQFGPLRRGEASAREAPTELVEAAA